MFIFLPNEAFHGSVYLINVDWHRWMNVLRIEGFVVRRVADALHVLLPISPACHTQYQCS
jgi:hypothetical protein